MHHLRRAARTPPHEVYESSQPRRQWTNTKRPTTSLAFRGDNIIKYVMLLQPTFRGPQIIRLYTAYVKICSPCDKKMAVAQADPALHVGGSQASYFGPGLRSQGPKPEAEGPTATPAKILGERCKLPQQGPVRSPGCYKVFLYSRGDRRPLL